MIFIKLISFFSRSIICLNSCFGSGFDLLLFLAQRRMASNFRISGTSKSLVIIWLTIDSDRVKKSVCKKTWKIHIVFIDRDSQTFAIFITRINSKRWIILNFCWNLDWFLTIIYLIKLNDYAVQFQNLNRTRKKYFLFLNYAWDIWLKSITEYNSIYKWVALVPERFYTMKYDCDRCASTVTDHF